MKQRARSADPPAAVIAARLPAARFAAAVFDLSRGRQALLSVAQPALGAVLALGELPDVRTVAIGAVAATAGFLAVFSLNDVLDRGVDRRALRAGKGEVDGYDLDTAFERHPLAAGRLSLRFALAWVGSLTAVAAVGARLLAPLCLLVFAAAAGLEVLYCSLRAVTWWKTVVSGLMVGLGGVAGWVAVAPFDRRALALFLFLALWEIGGRNIANDLADLGPDASVGLRTVATTFGRRAAARAAAAVGGACVVSSVLLPMPWWTILGAVALGVWSIGVPAVRLLERPTSPEAGAYFNRASLYPALLLPLVLVAQGLGAVL